MLAAKLTSRCKWQTQVKDSSTHRTAFRSGWTSGKKSARGARMPQGDRDPEQLRRAESLRLAYTELSRQLQATTHTARRQQLSSALAELERQLKALGARPH